MVERLLDVCDEVKVESEQIAYSCGYNDAQDNPFTNDDRYQEGWDDGYDAGLEEGENITLTNCGFDYDRFNNPECEE